MVYAFWFLVWMVILFLVVYDWRHLILPLPALGVLIVLGCISLFLPPHHSAYLSFFQLSFDPWRVAAGPFLALPFALLSAISRGRWMGWGDGILALPIGWMLGITGGITAAMLAFWIGALIGTALIGIQPLLKNSARSVGMKTALPFGPFLALGAAIVFFSQFDLFTWFGWWG
jgi:prepilin signal peptidase PulO-like enzyme (type II secretory pathway)